MAGFTNTVRGGRRWGTLMGLALTLAATALGGCSSVSKEKYDALAQENEELRQQVTQNQAQERQKEEALSNALQENTQLKQELANKTAAPDPGFQPDTRGSGRTSGPTETRNLGSVNFASGSVTLDKTSMSSLNSIASALNGRYAGYDIRIEGHADGAPPKKGKYKTNEALSEARADSVKRYLVQKGVSSSRITVAGMGSTTSKVARDGRRADVIVIGAN